MWAVSVSPSTLLLSNSSVSYLLNEYDYNGWSLPLVDTTQKEVQNTLNRAILKHETQITTRNDHRTVGRRKSASTHRYKTTSTIAPKEQDKDKSEVTLTKSIFAGATPVLLPTAAHPSHVPLVLPGMPGYEYPAYSFGREYGRALYPHQPQLHADQPVNWHSLLQLILLSVMTIAGTIGGIFIISSITVITHFQVRGNIHLVSVAVANLLITVIALPCSCFEIMAVSPNHPDACAIQWFLTQLAGVVTLLGFAFIGIENLASLRPPIAPALIHRLLCTKPRILVITLFTWSLGLILASSQKLYSFAPDLCAPFVQNASNFEPSSLGDLWPQTHLTLLLSVFCLPQLLAWLCFARCAFRIKQIKQRLNTQPPMENLSPTNQLVIGDCALIKANIAVCAYASISWTPMIVCAALATAHKWSDVHWISASWWFAWTFSCLYSFIYALLNRDLGDAFFKLFYYCCCKSHVTFARKSLTFRQPVSGGGPSVLSAGVAGMGGGESVGLRVHIIPGLNMSQRRDTSGASNGYVGSHHFGSHHGGHYGSHHESHHGNSGGGYSMAGGGAFGGHYSNTRAGGGGGSGGGFGGFSGGGMSGSSGAYFSNSGSGGMGGNHGYHNSSHVSSGGFGSLGGSGFFQRSYSSTKYGSSSKHVSEL